jgi:DnaJ-class molecular chaperone
MPTAARATTRGDLYARIEVRVPDHLTEAERGHYEALAALERDRPAGSSSAA